MLEQSPPHGAVGVAGRLAGALLVVVGVVDLVIGALALASDVVRLAGGTALGLLLAGAVTTLLGVMVWRGSRRAVIAALGLFGVLLVVQLGDVALDGGVTPGTGPALGLLAALVVVLVVALVTGGPRRRA